MASMSAGSQSSPATENESTTYYEQASGQPSPQASTNASSQPGSVTADESGTAREINENIPIHRLSLYAHIGEESQRQYDPDADEVESQDGNISDSVSHISPDEIDSERINGGVARKKPVANNNIATEDQHVSDDNIEPDEDETADNNREICGGEPSEQDFDDTDEDLEDDELEITGDYDELDDDTDEEDEADATPPIDLERAGCTDKCRDDIKAAVEHFEKQILQLEMKVRSLNIDLNCRDAKIEDLQTRMQTKQNQERNTKRTWQKELQLYLNSATEAKTYSQVYRLSCKEENMSPVLRNVHPNLILRGPTANEIQAVILRGASADGPEHESESEHDNEADNQVDNHRIDELNSGSQCPSDSQESLFVEDDEHPEVNHQLGEIQRPRGPWPSLENLRFDEFPSEVQANVLKFIFVQENKLIHCISRLDPFVPPEVAPQSSPKCSGLPHRFHVSRPSSCSITYTFKPDEYLALLSVCKRWYYLGIHAFYGLNTFAFSSLGEFGRFCAGIGDARRARIQHVELLWIGSQYLTTKVRTEGRNKQPKYFSRRTWDASWLCELPQLKSLTIHINEGGRQYERRSYEPLHVKAYMAFKTAGQPNYRLTRSLRNIQGLDFVYQLRGMEIVRFFDFEQHLKSRGRYKIRDWSFLEDVETVTAKPKPVDKAESEELKNLVPLLPGFKAEDDDLTAVERLYRTSCAFETEPHWPSSGVENHRSEIISQSQQQQEDDGDVLMLDVQEQAPQHDTSSARETVLDRGTADIQEAPRAEKRLFLQAIQGREESAENSDAHASSDDSRASSNDGEDTPRAMARSSRSATTESDKTVTNNANDKGKSKHLPGSTAGNPINVDDLEDQDRIPLRYIGQVKRGTSTASTASSGIFVRQDSYDPQPSRRSRESSATSSYLSNRETTIGRQHSVNSYPLFLPSESPPAPKLSRQAFPDVSRFRRESTALTDRVVKRGYDITEVQKTIDPTTGWENVQPDSRSCVANSPTMPRPGCSQPISGLSTLANPYGYLSNSGSNVDTEPNPFKKRRQR